MTTERIPVQIWSTSDLRSLKWGSILVGVGVGVFLPRGLRRYGRWFALGAFFFALKPLMAMLRDDTLICSDRPLDASTSRFAGDAPASGGTPPPGIEGAEAAT